MEHSTIAAIATAPGAGGIAVVRLSGPESYAVAAKVFHPANPAKRVEDAKGYTALFGHFMEGEEAFDEGVALFFRAPHSYTGEDVVELSCHGGSAVARRLVESCIAAGAAPAAPGEYTRRAFLNGKLGLTQAEAVMDLISADGRQGAALANASLNGALAKKIGAEKDALTALQAHLTAWVDFPEEDVPALEDAQLVSTLIAVKEELDTLIRNYDAGAVLREGVDCAIVGRPNVGKSSLLNALLGEKVAIVSPRPQTTRTRITGVLTEGATQLVFIDTPGLHRARNSLGEYMVRQVGSSVSDVDLAVLVTDASEPWEKLTRAEMDLIEQFKKLDLPAVAVLNKIDLLKDKEQLIPMMAVLNEAYDFQQIVPLSAKTGDGVALLRKLLHEAAIEGPHYFDDDMLTDQPERVIAAEMLREKALCFLSEEIPHGIAVTIETMKEREGANGPVIDIDAVIYCERKSHKGIIIGKGGAMLIKIATAAREELEAFLNCKVNLQCWVKVKEDWRNEERMLRNFGFTEER